MEFEQVYRLYFRDVYLYVLGLSGRQETAEEVTQETFFKALKAIKRFDGTKDIRAWLFIIAKHTYYSAYRRTKAEKRVELDDQMASPAPQVLEKLMTEERAMQIHTFLHTMREPYKEVFSLRIFGELSFENIGTLFGKNAGWARVTFYRAKKRILEYMEEIEDGKDSV